MREIDLAPELRWLVGTITHGYSSPGYAAYEILLDYGRSELFWRCQLEEAAERAS